MVIKVAKNWDSYKLLDSGDSERLEKFGEFILRRPDPQAIWKKTLPKSEWDKADAVFNNKWSVKKDLPQRWLLSFKDLKFWAKLSPFKHTGVFPEQSIHWEYLLNQDLKGKSILNLFGYTGIASLAALKAGAQVTHVDSSYPTIGWFKDNLIASGLDKSQIRWIEDDVVKFCQREVKRGTKYEGIIMDPPVYGHGSSGEVWDFNKDFPKLMEVVSKLLSDKPLFFIVNTYAISSSSVMLNNVLEEYLPKGEIEYGEICLEEEGSQRLLSTGIFAKWTP